MRTSNVPRALLLALVVALAYLPALRGGFIWDDDIYLTHNPLVTAPDGLRRIWFTTEAPSQYFPLVYTSFRLEHALWGMNPAGYHATNVLLHIANALLVRLLLARLALPGAWLAAALFALHPVQVESVAWVTERKNVLSLLCSLLALLAWLRYCDAPAGRRLRPYLSGLGALLLALFAKTTAVTVAPVLLLVCWLRGERPSRSRALAAAPFFAAGLAMALVSLWWEEHLQGTRGAPFAFTVPERILIAGRAFWFSLGKLAWPADLSFIYPRWAIDAHAAAGYVWPAAALLGFGALWHQRQRLGRGPVAAFLTYLVVLAPTLGFFALYTFRYSFVADHYQYAACIGPLALVAAALTRDGAGPGTRRLLSAAALVLVAALSVLTFHRAGIYRDERSLWEDTLARDPQSMIAAGNLGIVLMNEGRLDEAMALARTVRDRNPEAQEARLNLGVLLARAGRYAEAVPEFREAVRIRPDDDGARIKLGAALARVGDPAGAAAQYREALRLDPGSALARYNLGSLFAGLGRLEEAAAQLEEALRLAPDDALARQQLEVIRASLALRGRGAQRSP